MKKPAQFKEAAMGLKCIQKKCKRQKIASNSVTQHVDVVGSPFILWFLYVSFLKIVRPSMSPVKIASLERGVALMKLYQAQLKSPQQLLKSPQQLLKVLKVIASFINSRPNFFLFMRFPEMHLQNVLLIN